MTQEFVNVPVPVERVQEVYKLLAQPAEDTEVGREGTDNDEGSWTDALLGRAYRESPEPMRQIFDYLSDNPDRWITAEELAQAINRRRNQLAGVLGAFGRRWKNRYSQKSWPFGARSSAQEGMQVYSMSATVAAQFQRVRR